MERAIIKKAHDFYNVGRVTVVDADTGISEQDIEVSLDNVLNHLIKRLEGVERFLKGGRT